MYSARDVSSPYSYLAVSAVDDSIEDEDDEVDEESVWLRPFDKEVLGFLLFVLRIALIRNFIIFVDAWDIGSCFGSLFCNFVNRGKE